MRNLLAKTLASLKTTEPSRTDQLSEQWDRLREDAETPQELAEIDAIFSRHAA